MDGSSYVPSVARSLHDLEAEITELAGHLNAAQHRWLILVAEFDRRTGWSDGACQSCAHWLNFKCGIALGAARERVRVAHALETLPKISAAMARGALSYSKVRALTRIADAATEDTLLSIALHGTAQHVERLVQGFRRAKEAEEISREARQHVGRSVTYMYDDDGSLILKARLPAELGALVIKALDAAIDEVATPDVPAGTFRVNQSDRDDQAASWPASSSGSAPSSGSASASASASAAASSAASAGIAFGADQGERPSRAARRADALAVLAESFLKNGAEALSGGDRHQIVVHVDAETLRNGTPGQCEIEDGPSLPAETVRRFACDSSVVLLLENEQGEPLNVGRKTRSIPPALRRALKARDRGCRFPGCTHTRYVDAHHVHHWAHGGETKASNLVLLCRHHHRKVHEGGVTIETLANGAFRFVRPDGRVFDSAPPNITETFDWTHLPARHACVGPHIDRNTAVSLWRGERMDYGIAVEVLLTKTHRAQDVPAGTHT